MYPCNRAWLLGDHLRRVQEHAGRTRKKPARQQQVEAAMQKANQGCLKAALRMLRDSGVMPPTQETAAKVQELFTTVPSRWTSDIENRKLESPLMADAYYQLEEKKLGVKDIGCDELEKLEAKGNSGEFMQLPKPRPESKDKYNCDYCDYVKVNLICMISPSKSSFV